VGLELKKADQGGKEKKDPKSTKSPFGLRKRREGKRN